MNRFLDPEFRPLLRGLEALPLSQDGSGGRKFVLRDISRLSEAFLTVSDVALHAISLVNGNRNAGEICTAFKQTTRLDIDEATVAHLFEQLDSAHFIDGPSFESYYRDLHDDYVGRGVRDMADAEELGVDASGRIFADMLSAADDFEGIDPSQIRGVIAPHLDYPRGAPCYGRTYNLLRRRRTPDRVVILGFNHFGRSTSVVATGSSFSTPLGITAVDTEFLDSLEAQCGPLRQFELDHVHEHSVALQVVWLQYIYGADSCRIVPLLCPDPCGPSGTRPYDGCGVDLREFAQALGSLCTADEQDTLLVAGADLSHVGRAFGDDRDIDDTFLSLVEERDNAALQALVTGGPDAFVSEVTRDGNSTRICSTGCIFALATALSAGSADGKGSPTLGGYHQASSPEIDTCVTCSSLVYC